MRQAALDDDRIARLVGSVFERGKNYYRTGMVDDQSVWWDEPFLVGAVEGTRSDPYHVRVTFGPGGEDGWEPETSICTCPYDGGMWCKHAAALLLYAAHAPRIDQPGRGELAAGLEAKGTASRVLKPVAADQQHDWQEVESQAFEQVASVLTSGDISWRYSRVSAAWHEVDQMLDYAEVLIGDGEWEQAVAYLTGMTDAYMEGWGETCDYSKGAAAILDRMAAVWLDAILTADFGAPEKQRLQEKIAQWILVVGPYEVYSVEALGVALTHGTDPESLRLEGEDASPEAGDLVADAWLRTLDRQGDDEAYLDYAEAAGHYRQWVLRLIAMGRLDAAQAGGERYLDKSLDVLCVAHALADRGAPEKALALGLALLPRLVPYPPLLEFLAQLADGLGEQEQALTLYQKVFPLVRTFECYLRAKAAAGDRWPEVGPGLLQTLNVDPDAVHIMIAEGKVDEMVQILDRGVWVDEEMLQEAAEAALAGRPDWVVGFFTKRALSLIGLGQSHRYGEAARCLEWVREGYFALGQDVEWHEFRDGLMSEHRKKRSLMRLIQTL